MGYCADRDIEEIVGLIFNIGETVSSLNLIGGAVAFKAGMSAAVKAVSGTTMAPTFKMAFCVTGATASFCF